MAIAFVVEDGTGLTNATSYISVADANGIVDTYGRAWSSDATTKDKQQALNAGTQYVDARFHELWQSYRTTEGQALDWPRYGVVDIDDWEIADDVIPDKLKQAVVEVAVYFDINGKVFPDADNSGTLKREKIKIDVLEFEEEYLGGSSGSDVSTKVDDLLKDYIGGASGGGMNSPVARG